MIKTIFCVTSKVVVVKSNTFFFKGTSGEARSESIGLMTASINISLQEEKKKKKNKVRVSCFNE